MIHFADISVPIGENWFHSLSSLYFWDSFGILDNPFSALIFSQSALSTGQVWVKLGDGCTFRQLGFIISQLQQLLQEAPFICFHQSLISRWTKVSEEILSSWTNIQHPINVNKVFP